MSYYYYLDRTSNSSMISSLVVGELNKPIKTEPTKSEIEDNKKELNK